MSVSGWLALVAGLLRMVAPEAKQGGENAPTYVVIGVLFVLGAILTFNAYAPHRTSPSGTRD